MFVNISPLAIHYSDSIRSLEFGSEAAQISRGKANEASEMNDDEEEEGEEDEDSDMVDYSSDGSEVPE